MATCYYCKLPADRTIQVTSIRSGTITYDVCKTCLHKVAYGFLQYPTGNNMPRYSSYTHKPKEARLIYEPAMQAYSLKFSYDKTIRQFIKQAIPAHKRTTSGPPDWIWYFGAEYFDIVKILFDGHKDFKLTIVTQAEVEEMQRKQAEASSNWRPAEHSIEEELQKFHKLVNNGLSLEELKNLSKDNATKLYRRTALMLHPDRQGGDAVKMAELNSTWALLKEGYYIK